MAWQVLRKELSNNADRPALRNLKVPHKKSVEILSKIRKKDEQRKEREEEVERGRMQQVDTHGALFGCLAILLNAVCVEMTVHTPLKNCTEYKDKFQEMYVFSPSTSVSLSIYIYLSTYFHCKLGHEHDWRLRAKVGVTISQNF